VQATSKYKIWRLLKKEKKNIYYISILVVTCGVKRTYLFFSYNLFFKYIF
jgi:hypothetical protein